MALLFAGCLLSAALPASAGPKSDPQADSAAAQFNEAQKLFDQGKHEEALALFRRAYEASKSPNARFMIARSLRALGKLTEAYDELVATKREAADKAQAEAKYVATRDAAAAEMAQIDPSIGKLTVALTEPEGAEVTVNGASIAADRLGQPVPVEPGNLVVTAKSPDGRTVERRERVDAGQSKTLFLAFPSRATEPVAPAVDADQAAKTNGGGVRVAGFAVLGLGVAGMALFGVTGAMAQSKFSTLEEECGGRRCTDPKYADVVDSGKTMDTLATVGLVSGIAGLVGGTAMIVFGGPKKGAKPQSALSLSPAGAGLRLQGTF